MSRCLIAACLGGILTLQASPEVLLVSDAPAKPFSTINEIIPVELALARFGVGWKACSTADLAAKDVESADYIVVVGVAGFPPPAAARILKETKKPIFALGAASPLAGEGVPTSSQPTGPVEVSYRGAIWRTSLDPFYPVRSREAIALARVLGQTTPLAWRIGERFGMATLPGSEPLSLLFADLLQDFFQWRPAWPSGLVLVLENFHPGCSAEDIQRVADYLTHRKAPFVVATQMSDLPAEETPMPKEEFLDSLRFLQNRGGRVFLLGGESTRAKFEAVGLSIAGTMASPPGEEGPREIFNETIPGLDRRDAREFHMVLPRHDESGRWHLPVVARGGLDGEINFRLAENLKRLGTLRGAVVVLLIPAWLPFRAQRETIDTALASGLEVLDPVKAFPVRNEEESR